MQTGIRYLAENDTYKVYSLCESVYLKTKKNSQNLSEFEERDLFIAWHYGDPAAAVLLYSGNHVVVAGCGNRSRRRYLMRPITFGGRMACTKTEPMSRRSAAL